MCIRVRPRPALALRPGQRPPRLRHRALVRRRGPGGRASGRGPARTVAPDLERQAAADRHPDGGAGGAGGHLLLPGPAGPPAAAARPPAAGLPAVRPVLDRLVRPGPAVGGERADLLLGAAQRLPLGLLPDGSAGVHPVVRHGSVDGVLEPRRLLRLALSVRRVAGTAEPRGQAPGREAAAGAARRQPAPVGPEVHHLRAAVRLRAVRPGAGRAAGRGRALQDRHHPALRARLALRAVRRAAAGRGALHRTLLLPLPVPAGRGAGDSRAPAHLQLAQALSRLRQSCQRCNHECPVQAIEPSGEINPNECIQCLHCQMLYHHDESARTCCSARPGANAAAPRPPRPRRRKS